METPDMRLAKAEEAAQMSALAMSSKAYWGYSAAFMEACREELAVTAAKMALPTRQYVVATGESGLLGYYALEKQSAGTFELEALFVAPAHIGQGVGRALIEHAKKTAKQFGAERLIIQGDPHAEKFYLAAGGRKVGSSPSGSIAGRELPLFEIALGAPSD